MWPRGNEYEACGLMRRSKPSMIRSPQLRAVDGVQSVDTCCVGGSVVNLEKAFGKVANSTVEAGASRRLGSRRREYQAGGRFAIASGVRSSVHQLPERLGGIRVSWSHVVFRFFCSLVFQYICSLLRTRGHKSLKRDIPVHTAK